MSWRTGWTVAARTVGVAATALLGLWVVYLFAAGYVAIAPPLNLVAACAWLLFFGYVIFRICTPRHAAHDDRRGRRRRGPATPP